MPFRKDYAKLLIYKQCFQRTPKMSGACVILYHVTLLTLLIYIKLNIIYNRKKA